MKIFKIHLNEMGGVDYVSLTGGLTSGSVMELHSYLSAQDEVYVGEGVHSLAITFKSLGLKVRTGSKLGTSQMAKVKVGKSTLVDISRWGMELEPDRDEDKMGIFMVNGSISTSPTGVVMSDFKDAVFGTPALDFAQNSKMSPMEALLSSKQLPDRGFKPAYGGGLISSPADSSIVYKDAISYDIASSYPWSAATTAMPYGKSRTANQEIRDGLRIEDGKIVGLDDDRGFIGLFYFKGVRRKDWVRIPMVKTSDEQWTEGGEFDNLGMVSADILSISFCPDDLRSFSIQYEWDDFKVIALEVHRLSKLPKEIIEFLGGAYEKKESAGGDERTKAKLAINTIIGLWGTCPFKRARKQELKDGLYRTNYDTDLRPYIDAYVGVDKVGMASGGYRVWDFRWAVYACAAARRRIVEAEFFLQRAGLEVLYCDTDSIKMAGDDERAAYVFSQLNLRVAAKNREFGIPEDMGQWVDESEEYCEVVFRGKKFYANMDSVGKCRIHVSGLKKEDAKAMMAATTLVDIAQQEEIIIETTRPDLAELEDDPFGAKQQMLQRPIYYKYGRKTILIGGNDD